MKTQRLAIALTVLNLAILTFALLRAKSAASPEAASVLRGRALEIVDDQERVRAMIKIFPADPTVNMPDGTTGYPETVIAPASMTRRLPISGSGWKRIRIGDRTS
jgi:hypothetical protein